MKFMLHVATLAVMAGAFTAPATAAVASPAPTSAVAAEVICRYAFDRRTPRYWDSTTDQIMDYIYAGEFRNALRATENGRHRIVQAPYGGTYFPSGWGRQVGQCWT